MQGGIVVVLGALFALGCGDSAAGQCDKLFDHMLSLKGTKLSADKYKQRKAEFQPKCKNTFNSKTRMCMLNSKSQKQALGCLAHMKGGKTSVAKFNRYIAKSKTTEGRLFVKKLYDGARSYFMEAHANRGSISPLPHQFPAPSMPITPPLGTCCKGDKGKCAPQAKWWTHPVWAALRFSVDDPHYFSYSYTVKGKSFTVRAHADLDCDGEYSTFEMYGEVSDRFPDGPSRNAGVLRTKELE